MPSNSSSCATGASNNVAYWSASAAASSVAMPAWSKCISGLPRTRSLSYRNDRPGRSRSGLDLRQEDFRDAFLDFEVEGEFARALAQESEDEPLDVLRRKDDVERVGAALADGEKATDGEPVEQFAERVEAVRVLGGVEVGDPVDVGDERLGPLAVVVFDVREQDVQEVDVEQRVFAPREEFVVLFEVDARL